LSANPDAVDEFRKKSRQELVNYAASSQNVYERQIATALLEEMTRQAQEATAASTKAIAFWTLAVAAGTFVTALVSLLAWALR
jgi:hypothetical protein